MTVNANFQDRLEQANREADDLLSRAEECRDEATLLAYEFKKKLPVHQGNWEEEAAEDYLSSLERAVSDPQINQSKQRLQEIGFDDGDINSLTDARLTNYEDIDELATEYESLQKDFEEYVSFLIKDDILIGWLQTDPPGAVIPRLRPDNRARYEKLLQWEHLPEDVKQKYFKKSMTGGKTLDDARQLNDDLAVLDNFGIEPDIDTDRLDQAEELADRISSRLSTLQNEYGYSRDDIKKEIPDDDNLVNISDELGSFLDHAGSRRDELRNEIEEYAELLGEDPPSSQSIPELERHAEELYNRLIEEIGATGEQLLRFFQGEDDLPEDVDKSDLLEALENMRPLFQRRLEDGS